MKIALRILFLLLSLGICVYALWPDGESSDEGVATEPAATPRVQGIVRDITGGAALDAGQRAKETISNIQEDRRRDLDQLDSFSSGSTGNPNSE